MSAKSRILKVSGFHVVQFNVLFGVMYGLAWLFYDSVLPVHIWFLICNVVFAIVILPYLLWTMRG